MNGIKSGTTKRFGFLWVLVALAISAGCGSLRQARYNPVVERDIADLAGFHLEMIEDYTSGGSAQGLPPVSELRDTCRTGRRLFRQTMFFVNSVSGEDNSRSASISNLQSQFQKDCATIDKNLATGQGFSPAAAKLKEDSLAARYKAALKGERSRNPEVQK